MPMHVKMCAKGDKKTIDRLTQISVNNNYVAPTSA